MMDAEQPFPILLFDGVCNYCNSWVNFIIRHDKKKKFRFAALQSEAGKRILQKYHISEKEETAILIYNDKVYMKSTAGLHVLYHVGGIYAIAFAFIIFPEFVRDFYYNIIARNRYKWWGKKDSCMIPTEDVKERFLQ
jgi:predicted DCC family thiol-disulfide oxidoreductase YuxK